MSFWLERISKNSVHHLEDNSCMNACTLLVHVLINWSCEFPYCPRYFHPTVMLIIAFKNKLWNRKINKNWIIVSKHNWKRLVCACASIHSLLHNSGTTLKHTMLNLHYNHLTCHVVYKLEPSFLYYKCYTIKDSFHMLIVPSYRRILILTTR